MRKVILILFVLTFSISAQQVTLMGIVQNKQLNEPLPFASIRIIGTTKGITSNAEGKYEFKLDPGYYKLVASYIGYASDTLKINLKKNSTYNFKLENKPVNLAEITVLPEDNPANEVIRRAIIVKHDREKYLNDYSFKAYTKGIVKTTKDFSVKNRKADFSLGKDTADLKITGIIENESRGYFKKPKYYKDEITARKQSANTSSQINIFTGGRIIQNFYTDDIQFMGRPLPSPISDEALDYYYFHITDTLSIDKINVFKIHFSPAKDYNPGFEGDIYIADEIFAMVKIDVALNKAANFGGILQHSRIIQQFYAYDNDIYMPVDYRISVDGNVLGLAKFAFELNSIFYDYEINKNIPDDFFGMAIVKVLPGADKKDSTYWKSIQSIPTTLDESKAYKRIDSVEAVPATFGDRFSILGSTIQLDDNFTITGPMGLYDFNKVEGHSLKFNISEMDLLDKRLNSNLNFRYGFNDLKFKTDFSAAYFLGDYRNHSISVSAFNKLSTLFSESDRYSDLTSTIVNLLLKEDFLDYYYSKGFRISFNTEPLPILRLGIGFSNRTDNTAINNTDFSIFRSSKSYKPNLPIYDTRINALTFTFAFDKRNFIEDSYYRMRMGDSNFNIFLNGRAFISKQSFLGSSDDFQIYELNLSGNLRTFKTAFLSYSIKGLISNNAVPFQYMYNLTGNLNSISKDNSFRTIRLNESFGDRAVVVHLTQNFGDEFFRMLNFPILKEWQLLFSIYTNIGYIDLTDNSKVPAGIKNSIFTTPLVEAGFSIGQLLSPLKLEFTWRLTNRTDNNFAITLNSALF